MYKKILQLSILISLLLANGATIAFPASPELCCGWIQQCQKDCHKKPLEKPKECWAVCETGWKNCADSYIKKEKSWTPPKN